MNVHAVYLAIIAVLLVVAVFAVAQAVRARRVMSEVEERFGLKDPGRSSRPRASPLRKYRPADLLKPRTLEQYRHEVDQLIERANATEDFGAQSRLATACGRALAGGKRLRSTILLEIARATSQRRIKSDSSDGLMPTPVDAGEAALFVEYLHAASLVIDDLPEFDNDAVRRGKPTLHVQEGPAIAQLAALSLLAAGFQNMCRQLDWLRDNCPEFKNVDRLGTRLCHELSGLLGTFGAAGGQYMDISPAETLTAEFGQDALLKLAGQKTASFFELATVAGWLVAGGRVADLDTVRGIGHAVGVAYQIADDVADMGSDAERKKNAHGHHIKNFANEYGREIALDEMERNLNGGRMLLKRLGLWTPLWGEIYTLIRKTAVPESVTNVPVTSSSVPAS